MIKIALGLDCASKTGFSFYDATTNKVIESGVQNFTKKRGESNGLMFLKFRKWLQQLVEFKRPDIVGYEQAHHRGGAATEICVGLTTRVQEICEELGIESAPVPTGTLKIFATGIGNANKDKMIAAAVEFTGRPITSDDEADAIHVSRWAAEEYAS